MARLFNFFRGLFFKKESLETVFIFDKSVLQNQIDNLSYQIYPIKNDIGFKIAWEVIRLAKNLAALEIASASDEKTLANLKGRFKAMSDLDVYFTMVTTKEFHEKEKQGDTKGKIDLVKKERSHTRSNVAGIA